MLPAPDPKAHPWAEWSDRVVAALWAAGWADPKRFTDVTDYALRKIPGIGPAAIKEIRRLYPNPRAGKPALVPQPGGGALLTGGRPGNRGGRGAIPSAVRRAARQAFADRLPLLAEIADGSAPIKVVARCDACGYESEADGASLGIHRKVSVADQLRALGMLGKFGESQDISRDDLTQFFTAFATEAYDTLEEALDGDVVDTLRETLRTRWRVVLRDLVQ